MKNKELVWDLPVRLFHWLLVISLCSAWYTSDGERGLIEYHLQIGYFILGLIIFRMIWGVLGTKYAKFIQFIPTPKKLINYLIKKDSDKSIINIGHNPLGAMMVVLMLTLILSQAISGLFMNDDVFTTGPYYDSVTKSTQDFMSFIHNNVFDIIVIASIFHIGAAFYYLLVKKVNLIKPMITGYKTSTKKIDQGIRSSKLIIAVLVVIVVVAFLYWLLVINLPVVEEFYY